MAQKSAIPEARRTCPFSSPATRARPRLRGNGADFSDWLVMAANHNNVTLFYLIEISRELRLRFLKVDPEHLPFSLKAGQGPD